MTDLKAAADCETLAGEYYSVWIDCLFTACQEDYAECVYDHYLEQLGLARFLRERADWQFIGD